jgi:hypothetical protein
MCWRCGAGAVHVWRVLDIAPQVLRFNSPLVLVCQSGSIRTSGPRVLPALSCHQQAEFARPIAGNYRSCVDSQIIRPSAGMADGDHKADWRRTAAAVAGLPSDAHHVSHRDTGAGTSVGAGLMSPLAPTSPKSASASAFGSSGPGLRESQERARDRFILELEFVQCLASPEYLHWLSTNGYLVSVVGASIADPAA